MSTPIVLAFACGLACLAALLTHDRLAGLRARVADAFARIDAELGRRHEAAARLAEAATPYLRYERDTLAAVAAAAERAETSRTTLAAGAGGAADAPSLAALADLEDALSGELARLRIVVDAYPEARADGRVRAIVAELASVDARIVRACAEHRDAVATFDACRRRFPAPLVARLTGLAEAARFEIGPARAPARTGGTGRAAVAPA